MNTKFLKKDINNIKLSNTNSELSFFVSKKSFLDKNLFSIKDLFMEISYVAKNEYGLSSEEFYSSLCQKQNNEFIILDNGILLINNLFEKIKKNCLIFFRLKSPITYEKNNTADIIFTLVSPKNINTASKLQILSKLTRILKKSNIRKKIMGVEKPEDVLAILMPSI